MRPLLVPLLAALSVGSLSLVSACSNGKSGPPGSSSNVSGGVGSSIAGSQGQDPDPGGGGGALRTPLVPETHSLYARMEAPNMANGCNGDSECKKSGCSGETCAAVEVMSTCEAGPVQLPAEGSCGCVTGQCRWYTTEGSTLPESGSGGATGPICGDKTCAANEQCISYYGIAGPSGPKFQECGIPCQQGKENSGCPAGKRCQTIADGPGPVCR